MLTVAVTQHFQTYKNHLVSDPNSSLRAGDIVRIENEGRKLSRHIQHVVSEIIAPWGPAIEERPPIFTAEERRMIWQEKYDAKVLRRTGRGKREGSREARAAQGAAEEAKVANETEEDHVEGMVEGTQIAS